MIKKIGVLTSGGDSPGMNACIRAVVRTALYHNIEVIGFLRGYEGLIDNTYLELKPESVSGIIHKGGTILKTARSERFRTDNGIEQAAKTITKNNLNGLVVIGGDGSFKGASVLSKHVGLPIIGCAGTIDNDLVGTDFTIGYDTAINTVIEALDKIRDTAESHDRIFVVEVMGRDAGLIALRSAIASGAEALLVPELRHDMENLVSKIKNWRSTKSSKIIVVAEGDQSGGAFKVAEIIKKQCPEFDLRVSVLGHIQRGGNPTCMERVNASIVGFNAVKAIMVGRKNEMVGIIDKKVHFTSFEKAIKHHKKLNPDFEEIIEILSS
ncbi:6-phosphofructokinase [Aurantibacillus circumpalustris]|uniref:6-phosphofructokinase n=1 Tax=Aurantibacillus circumpalustris TaxID=3036359 RepID=UPI00295A90D7|nr:6-phosphofructokinase [Aurantibacillus circumpalustris]